MPSDCKLGVDPPIFSAPVRLCNLYVRARVYVCVPRSR